jgi:hypothetical protein
MKNQYFGDINDYRKYGLLRTLHSGIGGQLLVAWFLTPNDGSSDGGFRAYLNEPGSWRHYDPELYDNLGDLLRSAPAPEVSLIENSSILSNTTYYSAMVPDTRRSREEWRRGLFQEAHRFDLVFVDPDNGIEVQSKPVGRKGSSKYVTWTEIEELWGACCSVIIYQHFRRERREAFAQRMVSELYMRTNAAFCEGFRTPHVLFLLAAQHRHESAVRASLVSIRENWSGQIDSVGMANQSFQRIAQRAR